MESFWIPLFSSFPCELYEVTLSLRDSRANSTTANLSSSKNNEEIHAHNSLKVQQRIECLAQASLMLSRSSIRNGTVLHS